MRGNPSLEPPEMDWDALAAMQHLSSLTVPETADFGAEQAAAMAAMLSQARGGAAVKVVCVKGSHRDA